MKVQENLLNEEVDVYSFSKDDLSNVCSFREDDTCGDGMFVRVGKKSTAHQFHGQYGRPSETNKEKCHLR